MSKRLVIYVLGIAIMTLGIGLLINSNIGISPWDSVSVGLSNMFGLSPGFWTFASGIGLVVSIDLYTNSKIKLMPIIIGLVSGVFINAWLSVIPAIESQINISYALVGLIMMGLGIAMYTSMNLPVNPIDHFMNELNSKKNISIGKAKAITAGIGLVCGLVVAGPIGVGTVIIYISLPILISFFKPYFQKKM